MVNQLHPQLPDEMYQLWSMKTDEALHYELGSYYQQGELGKAHELHHYLEQRNGPTQAEKRQQTFHEQYNKIEQQLQQKEEQLNQQLADPKLSKTKKNQLLLQYKQEKDQLLSPFFNKNVKKYMSTIGTDIEAVQQQKDAQMKVLQQQYTGLVTKWPKLSEYLSLNRRELVSIQSKAQQLEQEDAAHYPKNVLIYLMGLAESSIFGIRNKFKRLWVKLTWKWKSDDIKWALKIFEEKIQIKPGDSPRTVALKQMLSAQLLKVKKAYIAKQSKNVGLDGAPTTVVNQLPATTRTPRSVSLYPEQGSRLAA